VAEVLFVVFNDPDRRPSEYRGPPMNVGSVLEIQGKCFAVAPCGFVPVEIWKSAIKDGNPLWSSAPYAHPIPRLSWRLRSQQPEPLALSMADCVAKSPPFLVGSMK